MEVNFDLMIMIGMIYIIFKITILEQRIEGKNDIKYINEAKHKPTKTPKPQNKKRC